ncbi:hypothetical protein [Micromonospora carbonacea]|uniref:Uncharacterized protein n=1 Tax=Micromonospora carbonacea TaxID=47853 RepID=A0A1C5ABR4_9ACTN|nr:hypothetical protein [Micromonospora carbonacea]SCF42645.1 hypothetical protein GA0070563_112108 [Micromonospora carbonacea]
MRYWFGGGAADYTITVGDEVTVGTVTGAQSVVVGGQQVTVWSAETGGVAYTDLLDEAGNPVTMVTSADGTGTRGLGQIPPFQAPDEVTDLWASAGGGPRVRLVGVLGSRLQQVGQQAADNAAALAAHAASLNPHSTGLANLSDVSAGALGARVDGTVIGWSGGQFTLLSPSQVAGALLLNPPKVGGAYVGQAATAPDPTQGQSGNPWLRMQMAYSSGDNNPDTLQFFSTTSGGAAVKTFWANGNGEVRGAPSTNNRIGGRFFEFYENQGGPSTGRFFELSTNPSVTANREPLLGAYGTAHSTQPGWIVATRVLAGLLGVRAGGSYNSLTAINWRGQRATTGAPTSGTWTTGDVVLDSAGAVYLCTAGGTPGTWTTGSAGGSAAPTSFVNLTAGTNMALGTKAAASRLDRGGDNGRLRGTLTATGAVSSGAVVAVIPTTAHRPLAAVTTIARYTGGGTQLQIATNGEITLGNSLTSGQSVWLDSITWDMTA